MIENPAIWLFGPESTFKNSVSPSTQEVCPQVIEILAVKMKVIWLLSNHEITAWSWKVTQGHRQQKC